jgi:signal transduction histidine kinase
MDEVSDSALSLSQHDEEKRLHELKQYQILETAPDISFDEITELAASITDAPKAMINLIYKDEQWSKSISGIADGIRKLPRDRTVCQYTILKNRTFEIPDLLKDERTKDFPYVKGHPHLRYYLGAPLITPSGYGIGALCVLDFKPRKATQEEKNNLTVLANQVMAQLELRKKNLELEKHNRFQTNLMKILSHDLRSPINGIIGIGELLLNMDSLNKDEEVNELLLNLKYSSEQLNQLVSDILNYTLTGQNSFKLDRKETNVDDIVVNMKKLYKSAADLKDIDLNFITEVDDKPVHIDTEKFKQIFGNLISNAIKFTPESGAINCTIGLDNNSEELILTVQDNGVGMSETTIHQILSGENPDTAEGTVGEKGTGLGTTIIYKFTKLHNGVLDIDSSPGNGTTVTVKIPSATS